MNHIDLKAENKIRVRSMKKRNLKRE